MSDLPSGTVLEDTPARALTFLRGVSKFPAIHAILAQNGYTPERHAEGWALLLVASGAPSGGPPPAPTPAADAIATLDAWDERGFARVDAALEGSFPEQHAYVFADGLAPSVGPAAVLGVKKLLERLDALESGEGRPKASHKKDLEALALLAERGIDKKERARLAALVKKATSIDAPVVITSPDHKREDALFALYAWYRDWSKTARAVIEKRAHLISLGLAQRKSAKKKGAPAAPQGKPA